jgi:hypothetical protein
MAPKLAAQLSRGAWITVGLLWVVGLLNCLDRLVITAMREPIVASMVRQSVNERYSATA